MRRGIRARPACLYLVETLLRQGIGEVTEMGAYSVWGFDPDEVVRAQHLVGGGADDQESAYGADEQKAARIPIDAGPQIYELRRMFRL
jgi:hypothetical protein